MAFEVRPSESARQGLRRLARKELGAARAEMLRSPAPGEAEIHAARRSVKKVRAIVRLIDNAGGGGLDGSGRRLRRVNRILSCLRDADAMLETLATLKHHHPELFSEHGYARIRLELTKRKQQQLFSARRQDSWKRAARQLRRLRKSVRTWSSGMNGFATFAPGLRSTCKRAREALKRARETNAAVDFHALRKETKALWYALRLIGAGTPAVAGDIRALHSAERWLGEDHNLVVLCAELSRDPAVCRGPLDVHRLQCAVNATQRLLRRKATDRLQGMLSMRPRDYAARVEHAWRARRQPASTAAYRAA